MVCNESCFDCVHDDCKLDAMTIKAFADWQFIERFIFNRIPKLEYLSETQSDNNARRKTKYEMLQDIKIRELIAQGAQPPKRWKKAIERLKRYQNES